jgi:hypothetical protein
MSQGFTRGVPIDTDPTLSLDSDLVVPSQKAIKDYVDTGLNTKQDTLTLTTAGTSGAATLIGATLNIPQYSGGGPGGNSIGELTGDVTTPAATAPSQSVAATLKANLKTGSFGVTVDGVTGIVQVGTIGYVVMPYSGTITGWSIIANVAGTISFDITSASGAIPTVSIIGVGGNYPTLTGVQSVINSTTMTNWTLGFAAGDVFGFSVRASPAPATIKNATLTIKTTRT